MCIHKNNYNVDKQTELFTLSIYGKPHDEKVSHPPSGKYSDDMM